MTDRPAPLLRPVLRLAPGPRTYLLAALLGVPVGAVAGVYLWLVRVLRELVWEGHDPRLAEWLPLGVAVLVTTTVGGLLVGLVRARHDRDTPHDLDDVLADVDAVIESESQLPGRADGDAVVEAEPGVPGRAAGDGAVEAEPGVPGRASGDEDGAGERHDGADEREGVADEREVGADGREEPGGHRAQGPQSVPWILRSVLLGIVSLTAGASLGPEAPLLALAVGFGQRISRLLRLSASEGVAISSAGALSGLFGGPLGAAVLVVEDGRATGRGLRLLGPGVVAGVTGFAAMLLVLPDGPGLRYDVPDGGASPLEAIGWAALAAVPAAVAAALLLLSVAPTRALANRVPAVPRATAGGLVLGLVALVQPLVLFSGEHEGQDLIDKLGTWTVGALLVLIVLKIVATATSLAAGYFGGQIFPGAFLGMAAGALVVAVFPAAPAAVVAAGAGAGTTVLLRRPLASALVMLLFFPLTASVPLLVGAGIGAVVVSLLKDRLPPPTPVGGH